MEEGHIIDETDKKILNVLVERSNLSLREIAKEVKVSVVTVMKRVRELEKQEIIKDYTVNLDYEKIGYEIEVIIQLRIAKGKLFEVQKKIAAFENVYAVYDITGNFDSLVIARFRSRRTMDAFLKKLQKIDLVERSHTSLVLNKIKLKNTKIV